MSYSRLSNPQILRLLDESNIIKRDGHYIGTSSKHLDAYVAKDGIGTVSDLASFARECLRPKLLSPTTVTTMNEVAFPGTSGRVPGVGWFTDNKWGLGPEIRGIKSPHWTGSKNSAQTWGHFGGAGTFVWIDPAADHALVCATDKPFGAWALQAWPSLSDSVLNELFLDQTP